MAAQPAPPITPMASNTGMAQHNAQARPVSPPRLLGNQTAQGPVHGSASIKVGERKRTARVAGARGEVVASGVDRGAKGCRDHLQVSDLGLDLDELLGRAILQTGLDASAMPAASEVDQLADLGQRKAQPYLDHKPVPRYRMQLPTSGQARPMPAMAPDTGYPPSSNFGCATS